MATTIIWFKRDLRLHDHPALTAAVQQGKPIVPIYIWSPDEESPWSPGGASKWWLHDALLQLDRQLTQVAGSSQDQGPRNLTNLRVVRGPFLDTLLATARLYQSNEIYTTGSLEPQGAAQEKILHRRLKDTGIDLRAFYSNLLLKPQTVTKDDKQPYSIFTPFYRAASKHAVPKPLPIPAAMTLATTPPALTSGNSCLDLESLGLRPTTMARPWDKGFFEFWHPKGAPSLESPNALLHHALGSINNYEEDRNFPARRGTSRLGPFLHFGQITPRQIYHYLQLCDAASQESISQKKPPYPQVRAAAALPYIRQLYWREFAHDQLLHHPTLDTTPLRSEFQDFPFEADPVKLKAWQRGQTGFPIVDAAMRELWQTGFMHNRARMVVGSFLVKDLMIHWQDGARWFWDTLVDADLANNSMGWQWIAGCGIDAAPYFRIFNPILQSQKFDPDGTYIKTYCPELARLPAAALHAPWEAPPLILKSAGVTLGKTYPYPIVDHAKAKLRAMVAYDSIRRPKV